MANKQRTLRVLRQDDLDDIVSIDETASKQPRREYYERKIASILNISLAAAKVKVHRGRLKLAEYMRQQEEI